MNWSAEHRPFPLPRSPWSVAMTWHDLLLVHWPTTVESIRAAFRIATGRDMPAAMDVETFDGRAYFGVVPFWMSGVRHRWLPPLPGLSRFPELNVRTYVRVGDKPGVYFFSLDAHNAVAVAAARRAFQLNYLNATMRCESRDGWISYECRRVHHGAATAEFCGRYRPVGEEYRSKPGALDHWFTERYALFSVDPAGNVHEAEIHHEPWPLMPAEAEIRVNTMADWLGLDVRSERPLAHYAKRLEVVSWPLRRV